MEKKKSPPKYTAEFRARGVRLYKDHRADYASDNAAYHAIAGQSSAARRTVSESGASRRSAMPANAMG